MHHPSHPFFDKQMPKHQHVQKVRSYYIYVLIYIYCLGASGRRSLFRTHGRYPLVRRHGRCSLLRIQLRARSDERYCERLGHSGLFETTFIFKMLWRAYPSYSKQRTSSQCRTMSNRLVCGVSRRDGICQIKDTYKYIKLAYK